MHVTLAPEENALDQCCPIENIMQTTNGKHICNLNFSDSHIKRKKKEQGRLFLIVYFL